MEKVNLKLNSIDNAEECKLEIKRLVKENLKLSIFKFYRRKLINDRIEFLQNKIWIYEQRRDEVRQ